MIQILRISLTALALALPLAAFAQSAGPADPLFASHEPLTARLEAPMRALLRDRPEDEELPGKFAWQQAGKPEQSVYVAVRTRGNFRRNPANCSFPPLRLNFRKSEVRDTLLDGQDKLKLVTPCRAGSRRYQEDLVKEYLAYRVLNALTDTSFRVRLLDITYEDSEEESRPEAATVFLIESEAALARRTGMHAIDVTATNVSALDPAYTNLVSVFQYLIGNTDFSPIAGPPGDGCCHNVRLFLGESQSFFPIPYDFDMSGHVSAKYAVPAPKLGLRSVRTRMYRGRCANNAHLNETVAMFLERKGDIYHLADTVPGLSERSRLGVRSYMDDFFETIEDEDKLDSRIRSRCLK